MTIIKQLEEIIISQTIQIATLKAKNARLTQQLGINKTGTDRASLNIGDRVTFSDKSNRERHGVVERLNEKTASLRVGNNQKWRVAYCFLFKVLDGTTSNDEASAGRYIEMKEVF